MKVIENWIDMWREKRLMRKWMYIVRIKAAKKKKENKQMEFLDKFKMAGLMRKGMKGIKLYTQFAGNKLYEKRRKEKIVIEVDAMVDEKKCQLSFLEKMIKELEEKHKIELRKKAILKS